MMKVYARVEDGTVAEIVTPPINPEGNQYPLEVCFPAEFVDACVEITTVEPQPDQRWTYDGLVFLPEVTPIIDVVPINEAQKQSLLTIASQAMAPILVSLQLGDATDEETLNAKAWQAYYRELKLVDVTLAEPVWPVAPH
jgi:hypothetical protein